MDEFRPEYVEALDSARWNFWWYIAGAIPFLLLIPAAIYRRFGCFVFPLSFVGCWLAFTFCVQYYWATKMQVAVTDAEVLDATADTSRLFGPALVGVPLVIVYVLVVGGLVYGIVAIGRWIGNRHGDVCGRIT